jgi:hypothetical protein
MTLLLAKLRQMRLVEHFKMSTLTSGLLNMYYTLQV